MKELGPKSVEGTQESSSPFLQREITKEKRFDHVLTKDDRYYAEKGFRALQSSLEQVGSEEFPELVVFLDTGARPLAAGVLPIAKSVAEKRGLPMPENRFLAGTGRPVYLEEVLEARNSGDSQWKELFIQKTIEKEKLSIQGWLTRVQEQRAYFEEDVEDDWFAYRKTTRAETLAAKDQEIQKILAKLDGFEVRKREELLATVGSIEENERVLPERLEELLRQTGAKHVLIVDDYLDRGFTLDQLRQALGKIEESRRPKVTFMSFYAAKHGEFDKNDPDTYRIVSSSAEAQERWKQAGHALLLPNRGEMYSGFIYSHKIDPWTTSPEDIKADMKDAFVGVKKIAGQAITKVAEERDAELMLQLRHEFRDIAKGVIQDAKR